jgi:cytochrome c biogenesis protein
MVTTPEGMRNATEPRRDVELPRLGPGGWARWAWRRLTSMRTALLLLMMLAVAAVPGSVFPQRRIDPTRVGTYLRDHPTSGPWLDRLGAFDVYASPWFSAIYLLLFVSLVGCIVPRSRLHWRAVRARPPATPRRLDRMPAYASAVVDADPDAVLAAARTVLGRRRYRRADGEHSVAAERGHGAETGNLVFHISLVALLVGIAAGSFLGYSGQALVVEGETWANSLPRYDSFEPGRAVDADDLPPFSLTLDSMRVKFEDQVGGNQFGAPREFDADLTVTDGIGGTPKRREMRVNRPLDVGGTRMFLVGNGYAPVFTVTDGEGNEVKSGPVPFLPQDSNYTSNGVLKLPDALPRQLGIQAFLLPTWVETPDGRPQSLFPDATNPRVVLTAWVGDLGMDDGTAQSVYVLDTSRMTQLRQDGRPFTASLAPGDSVTLPDGAGTVRFDGLRRYAALDIRYDPTKVWVLAAAVLALAGLTASLFVRRRRVWVRATLVPDVGVGAAGEARAGVGGGEVGTGGDGVRTLVEVAGLSRTEDSRLGDEVRAVLDAVGGGGTKPADQPPGAGKG